MIESSVFLREELFQGNQLFGHAFLVFIYKEYNRHLRVKENPRNLNKIGGFVLPPGLEPGTLRL